MGFFSFAGRVLFASIFILSAWQEFNDLDVDGGHAAEEWRPKFGVFKDHVSTLVGLAVPDIESKFLVAAAIAFKAIGGLFFIFGSTLGAYLLGFLLFVSTPILYDFYNYDVEKPEFVHLFAKFTQNLALFGALLFFLGMKNSLPKRQSKKKVTKPKTM